MKRHLIGLTVLLSGLTVFPCFAESDQPSPASQNGLSSELPEYYLYEGSPADVKLDVNRLAVKFSSANKSIRYQASLADVGVSTSEVIETGVGGWTLVTPTESATNAVDINSRLQKALESPSVEFASPVLVQPNGDWVVVTPDLLVRIKPDYRQNGAAILGSSATTSDIIEDNFGNMEGAYKLHCQSRNGFEVLALANRLALDPRVEWAEPDMLATVRHDLTPNDPGWSSLWGLKNTGQSGGMVDMDMDCDGAWDITTGNPAIKVLVLDDGAELTHPDLNIAGGADFTGSGTGGGPFNSCDNHATAVSGCVAAIINNGIGTIGSAPGCKVLSAKFTVATVPCDGSGSFLYSWLVSALAWGLNQGARVSNNSNGFSASSAVTAEYEATYAAGMIHFASAGNDGVGSVGYPGSLSVVNAISAITRYGSKASWSNYGSAISFAAPGAAIYTTDRTGSAGYANGNYSSVDGTSFSSPYAAGVAALVLSVDPELTPAEVKAQLQATATDLGTTGYDIYYGYGLLNAEAAIAHAQINVSSDVAIGPVPLFVNFTGSAAGTVTSWSWDFGDGSTSSEQNPMHEYTQPGYYSVTTTVITGGESFSKTIEGMESVYSDTLAVNNVTFDDYNVRVDISIRNFVPLSEFEIPFSYVGSLNIYFDSVTVAGLRSSFMTATVLSRVDASQRASIRVKSTTSARLTPGSGVTVSLWFHRTTGANGTNAVTITDYTGHALGFVADAGQYLPVTFDGSITGSCCMGVVGDVNGDGGYEPTIADVSTLISFLFINGVGLDCYQEADANQTGGPDATAADITIGDISVLIDHLFISEQAMRTCY
jgi:subtilisin family serine protease